VNGDFISTDGNSILGADDRAGIAVLLHLIRNKVPGRYVFFTGEEAGRVGSTVAEQDGIADDIDRVICWDRYGEGSIITHQMRERCCSNEFVTALSQEYGRQGLVLAPDNKGTFTDSYSFVNSVPECTNISVGYYQAHTRSESQNARFLVEMAEASVLIDWEGLPVARDPRDYEMIGWTHQGLSQNYSSVSAYSGKTRYNNSDDLIQAAEWGILSLKDVSDFLWEDPDSAASLLYDLLRGANLYGRGTSS
jgi:hypothetical protein